MFVLDLFSGSQSVNKVINKLDWTYYSVDIDNTYKPNLCIDILKWDYKKSGLKPDIIWASPPCTTWSIATNRHRVLPDLKPKTEEAKEAELIIKKMLEIINYFKPKFWLIENPRGRLKHYGPMKKLKYRTTVYYINYGHHCQKPTDIWSSHELWTEKPLIKQTVPWSHLKGQSRFILRNSIPQLLIYKLFTHLLQNLFK